MIPSKYELIETPATNYQARTKRNVEVLIVAGPRESKAPGIEQEVHAFLVRAARILTPIGCHTFRATGITAYLENGGTLEHAQQIAAREQLTLIRSFERVRQ